MTDLAKERRSFRWFALHSATGVIPVGAFLLVHLWLNAHALQGRAAYDDLPGRIQRSSWLFALEVVFVQVPLLFHAGFGAWVIANPMERPRHPALAAHSKSWSKPLQRVTGGVTFGFVAYHVWVLRFAQALGRLRPADYYPTLTETLSTTSALGVPFAAMAYLFGLAAASYHFANGVVRCCLGYGLVTTARGARLLSLGCGFCGLALFLTGAETVVYFATAAPWP